LPRRATGCGFAGEIGLVNPHYDAIEGVRAVKSYDAIILTAGLGHGPGSLAKLYEKNARAAGIRLVGPNCLGVLVPRVKLNASFAASMPRPGDLALISQSGAIATGLVEWAAVRGIGFSAVVSIGDSIDVDLADLLDYFAMDRGTRAILLYIESIKDARKFKVIGESFHYTSDLFLIYKSGHLLARLWAKERVWRA
jgi:acetyltransferase